MEPTRTKSLYPAWISLLVSGTLLCAQPQQRLKTGLICSCCSHSYRQLANHNNKESSYITIIMEYFHFQHVMHIQCPTSVPYVLVLVSGRPEQNTYLSSPNHMHHGNHSFPPTGLGHEHYILCMSTIHFKETGVNPGHALDSGHFCANDPSASWSSS